MEDCYHITLNVKCQNRLDLDSNLSLEFEYDNGGACYIVEGKLLNNYQVANKSQKFSIYNKKLQLTIVIINNVLCVAVLNTPILITTIVKPLKLNMSRYVCSNILLETIHLLDPKCKVTPLIDISDGFTWICTFSKNINNIKLTNNSCLCDNLDYVKSLIKNNIDYIISVEPNCIGKM